MMTSLFRSHASLHVVAAFSFFSFLHFQASWVHAERFPGKSIGSEVLQKDIYNTLEPFDMGRRAGCTTRGMKIVNTELVEPPSKDAKQVNGVFTTGAWVERWSTQNCGGEILKYLVRFTADGKGGAYFSISVDKAQ